MAYPAYLRERARELRVRKKLSLDEIAVRLALPKTTVYYWIRDLPLGRARRENPYTGARRMQAKYRRLREEAYERGLVEYDELARLPTFRDFVVLYIAEGYKRTRHAVSICNSDPTIVAMAASWLRRLSGKTPTLRVQHHADQEVEALRAFWADTAGVDPARIRFYLKTNSSQLRTRVWRCAYGVAAVGVFDTTLRARMQAWIDRLHRDWGLDSAGERGVAQPGSAQPLGG